MIGELEDMIEKALEIKQRTLFGIGLGEASSEGLSCQHREFFCRALRLIAFLTRCETEDLVISVPANPKVP